MHIPEREILEETLTRIRLGVQHCFIHSGRRSIEAGPLIVIGQHSGQGENLNVTSVSYKMLKDVTEDEAQAYTKKSADNLIKGLLAQHSTLTPDSEITVIMFEANLEQGREKPWRERTRPIEPLRQVLIGANSL